MDNVRERRKGVNFGRKILIFYNMAMNNNSEQNAGAAQQQAVKSKRDLALERLKERHPDVDYPDDEAIFGAIGDDYDADQKELGTLRSDAKALTEMFEKDPRSGVFLQQMHRGENPWLALIRIYGDDALDYFSDPENAEAIAKAHEEYLAKVTENKKLEEEYDKNAPESDKVLSAYREQYGEDVTNDAVAKMAKAVDDWLRGKITTEALDMARLSGSYDEDVLQAGHEGEIRGRNAKINDRLRLKKRGDGTVNLEGKSAVPGNKPEMPDLGALGREKTSIWERGGEKRTHHG